VHKYIASSNYARLVCRYGEKLIYNISRPLAKQRNATTMLGDLRSGREENLMGGNGYLPHDAKDALAKGGACG